MHNKNVALSIVFSELIAGVDLEKGHSILHGLAMDLSCDFTF